VTRLNNHARQALETLIERHKAYVIAKATIEAELKQELHERLSGFRGDRDIAMRLAAEAGVPRTQLGKAIGTSNYRTVQEILAETESLSVKDGTSDGKWALTALPDGTFSLSIHGMGVGSVSGEATVRLVGDDLEYVAGDEFVIPQVFRNGYADKILNSVG
jgi:hypothetical protein